MKLKRFGRAFGFIREQWCNYNTMKRRLIIVQRAQVDAKTQWIPQGWSVACCFWVKSGLVNVKELPQKENNGCEIDRFAMYFFFPFSCFSFSLPTFLHTGGTEPPAFRTVTKNKPGSESEQVAHQVTVAADGFMEVLQPRVAEHKPSLCK